MSEFVEYLEEQLTAQWAPVSSRRMFGGHGLYRDGLMFALVADDTLYLKVDDTTRPEFEAEGLEPFQYTKGEKTYAMGYHHPPPDALEDPARLAEWAERGYSAAVRAADEKAEKQARAAARKAAKAAQARQG